MALTSAWDWITDLLLAMGSARSLNKYQCPAHGMQGAHDLALSVNKAEGGRALLYCHAGCSFVEVLNALALPRNATQMAQLIDPATWHREFLDGREFPKPKTGGGYSPDGRRLTLREQGYVLVAKHPYAKQGSLSRPVARKLRFRHPDGHKQMAWQHANFTTRQWTPGLGGVRQVDLALYLQVDLDPAFEFGERIILCESESSVDALDKARLYATTWAGGASDPPLDYIRKVFDGHMDVLLVPDHDEAGLKCGQALQLALPWAKTLIGEPGEDARDILDRLGPSAFID